MFVPLAFPFDDVRADQGHAVDGDDVRQVRARGSDGHPQAWAGFAVLTADQTI